MIRVTLFKRDDDILGFLCSGHAGYAESGRDIVCAAVSALTAACANSLESVAHIRPNVKCGEGLLAVHLPEGCESRDAQILFQGLFQGLRDIQAQYPSYIRLSEQTEAERRKHSC